MSFQLSKCVGLTVPDPDAAAQFYESWLGIKATHTVDGLQLLGGGLTFFIDPGDRRPPLLEFLTDDLESARAILKGFGFAEEVWYGPGKLNLVTDPFGIHWNIYQLIPGDNWPMIDSHLPPVAAKIALQIHETQRAAQFYADILAEPAMQTPSGWTIDSGDLRLIIEPGLPAGPLFYVDPDSDQVNNEFLTEIFNGKSSTVDQFGTPWKLLPRPADGKAVISTSQA